MKIRGTVVPNMKSKLWATRLTDEVEGKTEGIRVDNKEKESCFLPPK